jgi:hypothetical protein
VEELRAMSVPRQELYLSSIVHAINWFRAVVNVYHDQVCWRALACMMSSSSRAVRLYGHLHLSTSMTSRGVDAEQ